MANKKNVAITTFYKNHNQGSALQLYALYKYIQNLGYQSVVFDFLNLNNIYIKKIRILTIVNRGIGILKNIKLFDYKIKSRNRKLNDITNDKFINFYKQFICFSEHGKSLDKYHAFITGSDQVWKLDIPNLHYVFFLRFVEKEKRISYAASFGSDKVPSYNKKKLSTYLNGMNYISVREKSGVEIVENYSKKKATHVLDPVLLAGRSFWIQSCNEIKLDFVKENYIVCYFLDDNESVFKMISKMKKQDNQKIIWVDTGVLYNGIEPYFLGPLEFVCAIMNANFVLTDSFHAVAFSLLFHIPFYVYDRNYTNFLGQSCRIESLLNLVNLKDRNIEPLDKKITLKGFSKEECEKIDCVFDTMRIYSRDFLLNSLDNINK